MIISLLKALDEYTCYRLGSWTSREIRESPITSAVIVQWKCSESAVNRVLCVFKKVVVFYYNKLWQPMPVNRVLCVLKEVVVFYNER